MEEIRVFHYLETLDLHGCRLGDSHDFFSHLTSEACSRWVIFKKKNKKKIERKKIDKSVNINENVND